MKRARDANLSALSIITRDSEISTDFPLKPRDFQSLVSEKIPEIPHRVVKPKVLDFPEELSPSRVSNMKTSTMLSPHDSRNVTQMSLGNYQNKYFTAQSPIKNHIPSTRKQK
jgi:hypothetical protein